MRLIVIGGAKRSGKSTLGALLKVELKKFGPAQHIDVDDFRRSIFKDDGFKAPPDSKESLQFHIYASQGLWDGATVLLLDSGVSVISTAGNSSKFSFDLADQMAKRFKADLYYLLLEAPTLEEAAVRASRDTSNSDMKDFSDENIRNSFLASAKKVQDLYEIIKTDSRVRMIPQGTPDQMLKAALAFIMA